MTARTEWTTVCIKDVCESIVDCVNKTAPTVDYETPYKMIRTTNIKSGWINLDEVNFVGADVFAKWNRRTTPRKGDVILTREAPLGEVGMLRDNDSVFLGQRLVLYRADPRKLDNRFLLYSLRSDFLQGQIRAFGSGATVEHMRVPDAEKLLLQTPPIGTQKRIGDILGSYDDLIENNTRRIKIMEEMARMVYQEWFVNFRFLGYEKVRMVNSKAGLVPQSFKLCSVVDAVDVNPPTKVPVDGTKPFVSMAALSENSMLINDSEARDGNSGSKFMNGDTLFARITPCLENGKTGFVQFLPDSGSVAFGSTEFIVLRSRTLCPEFVYLMARSHAFRDNAIKSMSGATGRQRVQEKCFERFSISCPPPENILQFQDVVRPLFRLVQVLHLNNSVLRKTRDLLLPKLISGEINVEQLETQAAHIS